MSLKYIRQYYKVPAKRGHLIRWTDSYGVAHVGRIIGATSQYLKVRIGGWLDLILHPTWNIEYLDAPSPGDPGNSEGEGK